MISHSSAVLLVICTPVTIVPAIITATAPSQTPIETAVPELSSSWRWNGSNVELGPSFRADVVLTGSAQGEVRIDLSAIRFNDQPIAGRLDDDDFAADPVRFAVEYSEPRDDDRVLHVEFHSQGVGQ